MMLNLSGEQVCALRHALRDSISSIRSDTNEEWHTAEHREQFQLILDKIEVKS